MRHGAVLILLVLLAGCAQQLWVTYDYDPAKDPQRFQRDRYACLRDAQRPSVIGMHGLVVGGSSLNESLFKECMQARGYVLTYR